MAQILCSPLAFAKMTADYKNKAYYQKFGMTHFGIDLIATDKKIYSSGLGEVKYLGKDSVLGNFVVVLYKNVVVDNTRMDLLVRYFHLDRITCTKGKINLGDIIGVYGATGQKVTGPHLHIEVDTDTRGKYYNFTPTLRGKSSHFYGRNYGAIDTMIDPVKVFHPYNTWCQPHAFCNQNQPILLNKFNLYFGG